MKGYKQIIKHVIPFLEIYVQPFSCKKEEYSVFKQIVLKSSDGGQRDKDSLIEIINLAYSIQGKGKTRKRQISEILEIIENKTAYFEKIKHKQ